MEFRHIIRDNTAEDIDIEDAKGILIIKDKTFVPSLSCTTSRCDFALPLELFTFF